MTKTKYSGQQTTLTFSFLMQSAKIQLKRAEGETEGSVHTSMASLILSAFSLEAALNHIGAELFTFWEEVEKNLSPQSKLNFICHEIKIVPDFGREPYQSVKKVLKFRNTLAHGKTETVNGTWMQVTDKTPVSKLQTNWQKLCNPSEARKVQQDIEAIVTELFQKAGLGDSPFLFVGHGSSIGSETIS